MPFNDSKVVERLYLKKELLEAEDSAHKEIRPLLVILGGGMVGVGGSAACIALHELGLGNVFDTTVGISAGACDCAYFLAGKEQMVLGTSIYHEELAGRFVKASRRPITDLKYLESVFREGPKALDTNVIQRHRSELCVVATELQTKKPAIIDAKTASPDIISTVIASAALPGKLWGRPVEINGKDYFDGSFGNPFPIELIIEKFDPTDILVIPNRTFDAAFHAKPHLREKIFGRWIFGDMWYYAKNRHRLYREAFYKLKNIPKINAGVIWAPHDLSSLEMSADKIKQLADDMREKTLSYFAQ